MAATTTICIDPNVKGMLDSLKVHKTEPYNSVVERLIKMSCDNEPLTDDEIKGIEESLEDIKAGRLHSEEEAKKMLGIDD
jgi:predicted transcriptional regulator